VRWLLALALLTGVGSAAIPLKTVARTPLPGAENRFDYESVDSTAHRLYIAHMDDDTLLVVDTRSRRVVKKIHAPGVHGVIAVPSLGRVYASATNDHETLTIDSRTDSVLARAPSGEYPDGLAFDPIERHVFVSDESGGVETVLNAAGRRIATISLGGDAGNVQYDRGSRMVLAAVQSRDVLAVIDPRTNRVVRTVSLPGCDHDHGLLVDAPRRLAFVACDGNATLLTLDLKTWKVRSSDEVGDDPDVLAFDTSLRRLYVASEIGVLAVFAERGRRLVKLGEAFLAPSAHSVAVDPATHRVYFPLERGTNGRPQLLVMAPR
jgi:DNA-binding beta-propeller fold protein YncE